MSFTIVPNTSLGFGYILIIRHGRGTVEIPCHNIPTAQREAKYAMQSVVESFAQQS
tara:strand:+ start:1758 stop:1925 length:168 start_codon:yes stop_codon:yes gene_type:complete